MSQEEIDTFAREWDWAAAFLEAYEWEGVVVIFDPTQAEEEEESEGLHTTPMYPWDAAAAAAEYARLVDESEAWYEGSEP